jgi:predicted thioesterase
MAAFPLMSLSAHLDWHLLQAVVHAEMKAAGATEAAMKFSDAGAAGKAVAVAAQVAKTAARKAKVVKAAAEASQVVGGLNRSGGLQDAKPFEQQRGGKAKDRSEE